MIKNVIIPFAAPSHREASMLHSSPKPTYHYRSAFPNLDYFRLSDYAESRELLATERGKTRAGPYRNSVRHTWVSRLESDRLAILLWYAKQAQEASSLRAHAACSPELVFWRSYAADVKSPC
jgi:hypothetical protein